MPLNATSLWIVATPIGNPDDLSPRARQILASVDVILAEDTRRAMWLLAQCGIRAARVISLFEHNEDEKLPGILAELRKGISMALVSDAGTPLLSDPGYRLVRACRKEGIAVSPVPGPSAPVAALSACGIAPLPSTFLGFLPRGRKNRADLFSGFAHCPGTLVFFERKDRLAESLAIAAETLGEREICICRELTKTHEEFIQLKPGQTLPDNLAGELTIVIGPSTHPARMDAETAAGIIRLELQNGKGAKQASVNARQKCQGWSAAELYKLAMEIKNGELAE